MRKIILSLIAVAALAIPATSLAQDPPIPPEFAPPAPAGVTDVTSAENFTKLFVSRNAWRFLRENPRKVRVLDANAACLQSPILDTRFGCVFTLRALVIDRARGWRGFHGGKDGRDHRRRVRIRNFGCLGFLRINGGPSVVPTAQVIQVECARVPRGDIVAPEPV